MGIRVIISLAFLVLLSGCGTKIEGARKNGVPVEITINNAIPHCGGAAPMPDDVWPKIGKYEGCNLSVHAANEDGSRGKKVSSFVTDHTGKVELNLPNGKYQLWSINKLENFHRFMELEGQDKGDYYAYRDEDCFKHWHGNPDFEFVVGDQTEFSFVYKNRCFVGSHPCLIYSGPLPP